MDTRTGLNGTLYLHIHVLFLLLPGKCWPSNLNGSTNYIISSLQNITYHCSNIRLHRMLYIRCAKLKMLFYELQWVKNIQQHTPDYQPLRS